MILKLLSIRPFKSLYSDTPIKKLRFTDLESKLSFSGYLNPKHAELYNTVFPTLRVGAHYIGYTHMGKRSINMGKLTLSAVQPEIFEQTALDLNL